MTKHPTHPHYTTRHPAYAWRADRYQIQFGRIPATLDENGEEKPNPLRKVAIFVVHGIGEQVDTETSVGLRLGIEDALPLVYPEHDGRGGPYRAIPPPYVYDGYWADYNKLEWLLDIEERCSLTKRQQRFFERVISMRSQGVIRNCRWLTLRGVKLVWKSRWVSKPIYALLTFYTVLLFPLAVLIPSLRRLINSFVNDARLYLEPKGDIELETVQRIDRTVGSLFLRLLGLDWDFKPLKGAGSTSKELGAKLRIGQFEDYAFDEVVWVAHSLGTVISYNVISDLLHRCEDFRENVDSLSKGDEARKNEILSGVQRVEKGLAHFVSLGSPLDKVAFLFSDKAGNNSVLRPWPEAYLPGGPRDLTTRYKRDDSEEGGDNKERYYPFWLNCFYGSDPISGPLVSFGEALVNNVSTMTLWRPPIASHVAYWKDGQVIAHVLNLLYKHDTVLPRVRLWPPRLHRLLATLGILLLVAVLTGALGLAIWQWDEVKELLWKAIAAIFVPA